VGDEHDGYISSGKVFLDVYYDNPNEFTRSIIFRGEPTEVLKMEQELIHQQIKMYGYQSLYNLTTWEYLRTWKRTCLHCGSIVDPRNEEWLKSFEKQHFENCSKNVVNITKPKVKQQKIRVKKKTLKEIREADI
jgi:hypothetical protein